ncbi:unannotated protein [freshwater metagenome]|uniref:Unannotated protein n=1 Tax=freshwater metagenome TaxID=449393 RepID=A0A6J7N2P5_9ZZZZ
MATRIGTPRGSRISDRSLGYQQRISLCSAHSDRVGWSSNCGSVWLGLGHCSHVLPNCWQRLASSMGYQRMGAHLCVLGGHGGTCQVGILGWCRGRTRLDARRSWFVCCHCNGCAGIRTRRSWLRLWATAGALRGCSCGSADWFGSHRCGGSQRALVSARGGFP